MRCVQCAVGDFIQTPAKLFIRTNSRFSIIYFDYLLWGIGKTTNVYRLDRSLFPFNARRNERNEGQTMAPAIFQQKATNYLNVNGCENYITTPQTFCGPTKYIYVDPFSGYSHFKMFILVCLIKRFCGKWNLFGFQECGDFASAPPHIFHLKMVANKEKLHFSSRHL